MEPHSNVKKLVIITVILGSVILSYFMLNYYTPSQSEELSSGGSSTHMYHSKGTIISIDVSKKLIVVTTNDSVLVSKYGEIVNLNCSKFNIDLSLYDPNDIITFYYFNYNVEKDPLIIEKIK